MELLDYDRDMALINRGFMVVTRPSLSYTFRLEDTYRSKQRYLRFSVLSTDQQILCRKKVQPVSLQAATRPLRNFGSISMGQASAKANGKEISYDLPFASLNRKRFQGICDLLASIADSYTGLITLGGEVVQVLETIARTNEVFGEVAHQFLRDIVQDTRRRYAHRAASLLCPHCFTRYGPFKSEMVTRFGCRTCGQTREYLTGFVVAVLDDQMADKLVIQDETIRVSWLHHGKLFDFDQVEIGRVSDEDIERFVVQVGNDTNPKRQDCYKRMTCLVLPPNELSKSGLWLLQQRFWSIADGDD
jgi:hypothetical protein